MSDADATRLAAPPYPAPPPAAPAAAPAPARADPLAVAALILGALSFTCVPAPFAALCALLAMARLSAQPTRTRSMHAAVAGFLLAIVLGGAAGAAWMLYPVLTEIRSRSGSESCRRRLAEIGAALSAYAERYDGRYPRGVGRAPLAAALRAAGTPAGQVDALLACPSATANTSRAARPTVPRYRGPAFELSENLPGETSVVCDAPDAHAGPIHVLALDGTVSRIEPGTPAYRESLDSTVDR
ncbi:MAG: hypothetical protein HZA54_08000 [Planctomycetes bacterium]|nr:hypothetical protein [Planctomycetota bacterium]